MEINRNGGILEIKISSVGTEFIGGGGKLSADVSYFLSRALGAKYLGRPILLLHVTKHENLCHKINLFYLVMFGNNIEINT